MWVKTDDNGYVNIKHIANIVVEADGERSSVNAYEISQQAVYTLKVFDSEVGADTYLKRLMEASHRGDGVFNG